MCCFKWHASTRARDADLSLRVVLPLPPRIIRSAHVFFMTATSNKAVPGCTRDSCCVRFFRTNDALGACVRVPDGSMGYAPSFHGRFRNGRIEGFLPARALEPQEMSKRSPVDFVSLIAKEMGRLHGLLVTKAGPPGEAEIWHVLPKWLELAKGEWASGGLGRGCRVRCAGTRRCCIICMSLCRANLGRSKALVVDF